MVTTSRFFADPELFAAVKQALLPSLFDDKDRPEATRIWSVGCATGEETYSLVMLYLEEATRRGVHPRLKIFATDREGDALRRAREGFYRGHIENEVTPERIARFFHREYGGFRVRKEVRDLVTFASHELLTDPPFSRLDGIWCRETLSERGAELQQATSIFYYALKPAAFLILSSSSSIPASTPQFRIEDERHAFYRRAETPLVSDDVVVLPMARRASLPSARPQSPPPLPPYALFHLHVLEQYNPPSLLLNPEDQVAHISNEAGRYLHYEAGALTSDVFQLVHHDLRHPLESLLIRARTRHRTVRSEPARVTLGGATSTVILEARPASIPDQEGFLLVVFEEVHTVDTAEPPGEGEPLESLDPGQLRTRLRALEAEQRQLRDRLKAFQHEQESNESDLQSSNEELVSANEEFRAVMEELEASKETLQSANEKLEAVNNELQERAFEFERLSNDLRHFLEAPEIATVFLDRDLKILRFTPKLSELFNVRVSDQGRPLSDVTHRLIDAKLQESALEVLQRSASIEREVQDTQGRWYLTRVLPYRDVHGRVAGVVVNFVEISERKEAEEAALAAKREAEDILTALPEPLLVFDYDLRIRSANPAFCQHFQIDPEQCTGARLQELGAGWEIPRLRELLETVMTRAEVVNGWSLEHDFGNHMGRRVLLLNARRLSSKERILLAIHDITERARAEQAVRTAAEKLRRMVNIDGVGILTCDGDGTLLDANDAFLKWSGHTRDDIRSRALNWGTMMLPEHAAHMQEQLELLYRSGRLGPLERQVLRRDGVCSWILSAGATLGDGTFVEYCIDITDRKQAEEALRRSEQQYRSLFESIDEGYCVIEMYFDDDEKPTDYRFLEINPIFSAQTGLEDPTGKRMRELVPDHEDAWFEIYGRVAKTGEPVRFQRAAASMGRFYDVYAFRIGPPAEHKVAVLFNDIGPRKKLDDQLRTFAEELTEANERKDEYLAMLGHELRNPLAAIRSAAEVLKLIETGEPRLVQAHRAIERQSLHMSRLIDGLLEVSRIARGKVQIEARPVELRHILEAVLEDRGAELSTRGLEVRTHYCEEPLWTMGDASRLTQVFDNLLGNAIKFTKSPGRITLVLERQAESAMIRLQDTGVGIRQERLTRIFEAFHQETPDAARTSGGLGLGLALASGLVALHQGSIRATSAGLGKGSTFEVRLPRLSHFTQPSPIEHPQLFEPCRILIVEDNPDAGEMLLELLQLRGHRVNLATNGLEALEELEREPPDVVLCDLGLPGMSGYEVAQTIRKNETLRGLPLVAVTGYGQPSDRLRTTAAGFDGHLIKPVNLRELEDLLGHLTHHRHVTGPELQRPLET